MNHKKSLSMLPMLEYQYRMCKVEDMRTKNKMKNVIEEEYTIVCFLN